METNCEIKNGKDDMARRGMQKKPWWVNLAEQALIFALVAVSGVAALLVHIYASQWAALAVWSSIAIFTLAIVAYSRLRRFRYRWLFLGMFIIALGFSILLAVMQGWETQTNIGVIGGAIIGVIVLFGALARSTARFNRRIAEGARKIGEQLQGRVSSATMANASQLTLIVRSCCIGYSRKLARSPCLWALSSGWKQAI